MKKIFLTLTTVVACLATVPVFAADTDSLEVTCQVVRVPAAHRDLLHKHLFDATEWAKHIANGEAQVLESGTTYSKPPYESLVHSGEKVPIAYFDPRVNGYQVQYIDTNFKIDSQVKDSGSGFYRIDVRLERMALDPHPSDPRLPESDGFMLQTMQTMKPGHVAVLTSTEGRFTGYYLKHSYPNVTFQPNDLLVTTVSLQKR